MRVSPIDMAILVDGEWFKKVPPWTEIHDDNLPTAKEIFDQIEKIRYFTVS